MKFIVQIVTGVALTLGAASVSADEINDAIAERTSPVSSICVAGDPCAAAPVAAGPKEPRTGEQVYTASCGACHASGVSGAPKFGDAADWSARLSDKGLEMLYSNAINGINAMPPKGLCMDCSDDEIHGAIDYMMENSQ